VAGVVRMTNGGEITARLLRWGQGDRTALDEFLPAIYDELRRLARQFLSSEGRPHTLSPTALVHEAYLRLIDQRNVDWRNRAQFIGLAAQMMRRILVNYAEARNAARREGSAQRVDIRWGFLVSDKTDVDVILVDRALRRLAKFDARQEKVVEMRFFGGLTIEETAEALGISASTVKREWEIARAWLARELAGGVHDEHPLGPD
jgi:RNA polymerase sigma-70 factor (ECF subfamily)